MASQAKRRRSSVLSDEQHNFLERRLANRPEQEKIEHNSKVAHALQGTMKRLENEITKNTVGHMLESRPEQEDLVRAGIAKPLKQAGRIQQAAVRLERRMSADLVGHALEKRPEIGDLENRDILKDQRTAPALQGKQKQLQTNLARSNLYHALKYRPSVDQLVEKGVYPAEYAYEDEGDEEYDEGDYQEAYEFEKAYAQYCQDYYAQYGEYPDPQEFLEVYQDWLGRSTYEETGESEDYEVYQDGEDYGDEQQQYEEWRRQQEEQQQYEYEDYGEEEDVGQYYEQPEYDEEQYYEDDGGVYEPEFEPEFEQEQATSYQRRSKNFHLTRILLKFVASMAEAGEISLEQKGWLKDLVVDQDTTILAVAETFDAENDLNDFKDSLVRLASRTR